jgi:hypothetical protein
MGWILCTGSVDFSSTQCYIHGSRGGELWLRNIAAKLRRQFMKRQRVFIALG